MHKIGLTGGICTGKTYVLGILAELHCYTVRADDIAKTIIFSGDREISGAIREVFGSSIFDGDRTIKKEEFSRTLFEDPEKRNFINHFIHPLVIRERNKILDDLEKTSVYDFFIYESALLIEAGTYKDFEKIVVVYTSPEEQTGRLMRRDGIDEKEAEKKIKAQMPLTEKLRVAQYTIDTSGTFENARAKTLEVYHLLRKDFKMV